HFKAQKPSSINVTRATESQKQKENENESATSSQAQHELDREVELELGSNTTVPTNKSPALPAGLDVLNSCLNELKLVTQRYSKKQIKWINNRFLGSEDRQVPDLYELDTSDVKLWQAEVYARAVAVIESYRSGVVCEIQPMTRRQHPGAGLNEEISNYCKSCQRHFIGEFQWQLHLKSNKHKKRREAIRKKEKAKDLGTITGDVKS
ncbi:PREDICTED: tRNA dimethylallyltransferase, mitochondrial-like, partial [Rhagoletis zephyria]|uniref:tRNA dimethylallyltransferase, mitochondrial-like n=1 Tax=Rhagoletis zephyria TaxID=28612 RepID=UPI00081137B2